MNVILKRIMTSLGISTLIYFGLAASLIMFGIPQNEAQTPATTAMSFDELFIDYEALPELQTYLARDGVQLDYRYYPAVMADKVLILLHGSGWHSQYFMTLANQIATQDIAHVYTPDLRGHGFNPVRRGDIDYIDQYEDDIADLIAVIREIHPASTLIIGGHSSGGGLALRFGGSQYGHLADAYILLAPFLKYNAPTAREDSGGWAIPYNGRIAGLVMLNNLGIRWFNSLTVIEFNMPEEARDGTETLSYTYRLNTAFAPRNYKRDLRVITQPLLVVVGTADEAFYADQFEPAISQYANAQVELLKEVTHMGVVVGDDIQITIKEWLEGLGSP